MAGKGLIAFIVLCFTSAAVLADATAVVEPAEEARLLADVPKSPAKADQRLFVSDGTQITMSTETLALGVLLLGLVALALVVLPGLLGGGDAATATAYETAPSTYAQDPYAARSSRSTLNIVESIGNAAKKFL